MFSTSCSRARCLSSSCSTVYSFRLDSQIRELQDHESAKLENWKTASEPLHEWLGGMEDDAKEHDVMVGNISQAQIQLEELKVS